MPSEATTYLYTLITLGAVGLMITATFQAHVTSLQSVAEKQELKSLIETIAAESTELIALTGATGATARIYLHLPNNVGNKKWWARLVNDSDGAWIESSLGEIWSGRPLLKIELPPIVSASGSYQGEGVLSLTCTIQGSNIVLTLGNCEEV